MANSNGWGDGAANNAIGWGQGANNNIGWGDSHAKSWAGATDIVGLTTDADAQAFITAAAITDTTQIIAINNLVVGMKADGIWTKMKAIYPFVGGTASTHKYNLKDPRDVDAAFRLVFNGGWTHSSTGATPNGTNGYADTFYSPSLNSTITNNHFMLYLPSVSIPLVITTDLGALSGDYNSRFQTNYFQNPALDTTNFDVRKRTSVSNSLIGSGCVIYSRTAINSAKVYFNNSIVANDTSNTLTYALPNITVYLAAGHVGTTTTTYSNRLNSFTSIGDGLTDTEASSLYTRVQAYQTALSRQV
jgi:hypothetical protein